MKIKFSKSQWEFIGKKTGWLKSARFSDNDGDGDGDSDSYAPSKSELMGDDLVDRAKKEFIYEHRDDAKKDINDTISYIAEGVSPLEKIEQLCWAMKQEYQFAKYLLSQLSTKTSISLTDLINFDISRFDEEQKQELIEMSQSILSNIAEYEHDFISEGKFVQQDSFEDFLDAFRDGEEEARDPYGYRGLSRRDF